MKYHTTEAHTPEREQYLILRRQFDQHLLD